MYATRLYITFMHNFLSIFVTDMNPEEAVYHAAWRLGFIGYWETSLRKAGGVASVKDHFLSRETAQDVIITCNGVILYAAAMRDFCFVKKVGYYGLHREGTNSINEMNVAA